MTAIQVSKRDELPDAIRNIIEAVRAGELAIQIEAVAEKGIPEIRARTHWSKREDYG